MSTARSLLSELSALGITVRVEGAYLRLCPSAPPDLLARVRAAKPELISLLSRQLDQGLACREVLGFPAHLLGELPIPTSLVCEPLAGGDRRTLDPEAFAQMTRTASSTATVADVLAHHGLRLRAVIIDGGAP